MLWTPRLLHLVASGQATRLLSRHCSKLADTSPWHYRQLSPFGKLELVAGGDSCHVIQPIDPVNFPDQNEAIVRCSSPEGVHCDCKDSQISVTDVHKSTGKAFEYRVPLKFGLSGRLVGDATLHIQDMESGQIHVQGERATCHLTNVKSEDVSITTSGSVITQSTLHCNGRLHTAGTGGISLRKALGTSLSLTSDSGDISVDSLYVENTQISTNSGNVRLGAIHRNTEVDILNTGDLTVGTLDGSLSARVNNGNVKIHVTQVDSCDIRVNKGDITVELPDSLSVDLHIHSPDVSIDQQFHTTHLQQSQTDSGHVYSGRLGSDSDKAGTLRIECLEGRVSLTCKDWFSSLGLKAEN